ncbi:MAG: response regulator, partial [Candidatus Woesebacteria bacterium]|nr:response regulator [Candidatus Woesebacteria bacterium]
MKNERILVAEDDKDYRENFVRLLKLFGEEDGHTVIGIAASKAKVEALLQKGLKPTVAFVDNGFYGLSQGGQIANLIRQFSPETVIISNSMEVDFS